MRHLSKKKTWYSLKINLLIFKKLLVFMKIWKNQKKLMNKRKRGDFIAMAQVLQLGQVQLLEYYLLVLILQLTNHQKRLTIFTLATQNQKVNLIVFIENENKFIIKQKKLGQNIINLRGTSKKKLKVIGEYFEKMKEINCKQPAYNLYLVEEIKSIIQRHSILNDQETIMECIKYLLEIQIIMESSQKYNIYYDEYFKSVESIVSNLIQTNIHISDNQFLNVSSFCLIKTNDLRQMNTFAAYLKLNKFNLNEQKPQIIQDILKKSLQIINDFNSNENEFQFKNTQQTYDSSYVNPEDFLKFYDQYKKQYYSSTLYQISDLINQLQPIQKKSFQQEIKQINDFIQQKA
ncbi:hypothetical protein ABPG74_001117 [Tetrahymena malaccensis]